MNSKSCFRLFSQGVFLAHPNPNHGLPLSLYREGSNPMLGPVLLTGLREAR